MIKKKLTVKSYGKIKYTDNDKLIEMIALDYSQDQIANIFWVCRQTVSKYINDNSFLLSRVKSARMFQNVQARQTVSDKVADGDARLALDYLKLTDEKFKPKQEIQNNTQVVTILTDIRAVNKGNRENSLSDTRKELPMIENTWEVAKMHTAKEDEIT